ncbi:MAG: DNA internalization-related competence protein ComEC/Rec2 [Deltaproteobacteria bacterium]|nr:DNA internalization-related competence protein ComEC/Rec2 [Deltaproteobacteria bacterium]
MGDRVPVGSLVLLPLTAGVLAGGGLVTDGHVATSVAALVTALVLAAAGCVAADRHTRLVLLALVCGGAIGAARAWVACAPLPRDHIAWQVGPTPIAIEGTVVASAHVGTALRLRLHVERYRSASGRGPTRGAVGLTIAHPTRDWLPGTQLRAVGRLHRPRDFGNPGEYDTRRTLARQGIYATMFLWDERGLTTLDTLPRDLASRLRMRLAAPLARVRSALGASIDASADEPARGFLRAVLIGEGRALTDDARRALARTGLSHVACVAGFHLAVVTAAAVLGVRWLLLRSEHVTLSWNVAKIAALAGVPMVAVYAALAGGSISASRSHLMYVALLTAVLADRRTDGIRSLAAAALVLALAVPDVVADISFELSFASVAALILTATAPRTRPASTRWQRVAAIAIASLRVSCAAGAATAPLTAWHFQQVSFIGPLANLLTLPLLGPATLLPGLAALPLLPVAPLVAGLLLRAAALAATTGLALAAALAAVPGAALETPMPTLLEVAAGYAVLALPIAWRRLGPRRRAVAVAVLAALTAADAAYWTWERCLDPRLRVTFLSVGQGDAAVVELPHGGGTVVIDGGGMPGGFDTGERLIAPFLRSRKIMRLDALALSHPQLDHYGGLAYLAEHFAPREFWSNGRTADVPGFARLTHALDAAGTRRVVLRRGMCARERGGARIDAVHPVVPDDEDLNDGSLVLHVAYGAASVLFTGDVERPGELEMLAATPEVGSAVLKVAHHGSATSTAPPFLDAVAPRLAVISDGADNRFGFPAPVVLQRLREAGVDVWRTDEDGAVRVVSDGVRLVVSAPCGTRPSRVLGLTRAAASARFEFPTSLW